MICGIDEAGRGPVIGPMVIAKVCGDNDILKKMGVRDSKLLSETRREYLFQEIRRMGISYEYLIVREEEIDSAVPLNLLNRLEAEKIATMLKKGNSYVVDCPDVNEARFRELLTSLSGVADIIAEHKADFNYPVVSAASVVAKVIREREVSSIKSEIGNFGSGYPSDPTTIEFLKSYVKRYGELPPHTRKSWKTSMHILSSLDRHQKLLFL